MCWKSRTSCWRELIGSTLESTLVKLRIRETHCALREIMVKVMSVNPVDSCTGFSIPKLISSSLTFKGGWDCSQLTGIMGSEARSIEAWMSRKPIAAHSRLRISRSNGFTEKGGSATSRERAWAIRSAILSIVQMRRLWS